MGNGVVRERSAHEEYALDLMYAFNDTLLDSEHKFRPKYLVSFDDALEDFDGIQEQIVGQNWEAHEHESRH